MLFVSGIGLGEWLILLLFFTLPAFWVLRDVTVRRVAFGPIWALATFLTGPIGWLFYLGSGVRRPSRQRDS